MVFALELKLSKTLSGLVYFVLQLLGGLRPPYKYGTKYTSTLRVFDNFDSKAKNISTLNFCKIENVKSKAARFLPSVDVSHWWLRRALRCEGFAWLCGVVR